MLLLTLIWHGQLSMMSCGCCVPACRRNMDRYWVASGAYWAYMWVRAAVTHGAAVGVVGQSQFVDSPDREPGVSMIDWTNGNGTAK